MSRYDIFMDKVRLFKWTIADAYRCIFKGADMRELDNDIYRIRKMQKRDSYYTI